MSNPLTSPGKANPALYSFLAGTRREAGGGSLITIKQAAEHFQVSTKTVRRRIQTREWPCIRVGRVIRLDLGAIVGRT